MISTRAKVWIYPSEKTVWHFVTLSKSSAEQLKRTYHQPRRGWGSIPVIVTIGISQWKTSVFPDSKSGSFILPIKAKIRSTQGIQAGQTVSFTIEVDRWRVRS